MSPSPPPLVFVCQHGHPRAEALRAARVEAWPIVLGAVATGREAVAPRERLLQLDLIGRLAIAHEA